MTKKSGRRRLRLVLIPIFAGVFWVTALVASTIPGLLVLGVNVHGLRIASYAGDPGVALAPLSEKIINDVNQGRGHALAVTPTPTPAATGAPGATPTPTATPNPTPSPTSLPSPSATGLPVPLPTLTPLPSLVAGPTPTPTPTPAPVVGKAAIKGQVTDTVTHLGIAAATVTLSPSGASQLTDTNGNFAFTVDAGTYTVTVNAAAYNNASQTVTVSPGQSLSLSFSLAYSSARGSITGSVKDSQSGAAIAGALVQATGGFVTVTDLSGSFTFPAVYPGANTVTVSQPGYVTQSQSIKVRQWQSVAVAFSLVKG